jgi:hypothetical protein
MSESSYSKTGRTPMNDSLLHAKNFGMMTPEQKRSRKNKYKVEGNSWLLSAVVAGF